MREYSSEWRGGVGTASLARFAHMLGRDDSRGLSFVSFGFWSPLTFDGEKADEKMTILANPLGSARCLEPFLDRVAAIMGHSEDCHIVSHIAFHDFR